MWSDIFVINFSSLKIDQESLFYFTARPNISGPQALPFQLFYPWHSQKDNFKPRIYICLRTIKPFKSSSKPTLNKLHFTLTLRSGSAKNNVGQELVYLS